jgi:hypothetical protein
MAPAVVWADVLAAVLTAVVVVALTMAVDAVAVAVAAVRARVHRAVTPSPADIAHTGIAVARAVGTAVVGACSFWITVVAPLAVVTRALSLDARAAVAAVVRTGGLGAIVAREAFHASTMGRGKRSHVIGPHAHSLALGGVAVIRTDP